MTQYLNRISKDRTRKSFNISTSDGAYRIYQPCPGSLILRTRSKGNIRWHTPELNPTNLRNHHPLPLIWYTPFRDGTLEDA